MKRFFFGSLLFISCYTHANDSWLENTKNNIKETYYSNENVDLYLPSITWHARFAYSTEKARSYNETPSGIGIGKSRFDSKGNWHGLYIMGFKDSFSYIEPIAGYGWEKIWRPVNDDFRLGLGYTAGITARHNLNYVPLPLVLPMASVGYGPATFQMTYIPGTYNNGNVYFAWFRLSFK